MKAGIITTAAIAAVLVSGHIPLPAYGQTPPKPEAAAVVVASEARAVVESVDKQARRNVSMTLRQPMCEFRLG